MNKRLVFCSAAIVASIFTSLSAVQTTTSDFINIHPGARPAGMGDAFTAVADETSGVFYNPAGPGFMLSPELQLMHYIMPGDVSGSCAGYSHPRLSGTYGIALQHMSGPSQYSDSAASLFYARRTGDTSSLGLNLHYVQNQSGSARTSAALGDVGYLYRTPGEGFSFGITGHNVANARMGDGKLPSYGTAGMAFKANLPEQFSELLFSIETGSGDGMPAYYAAGIEHWGARTLGLRVGYRYPADEQERLGLAPESFWRAGIGLRIQSLSLDYAYQPLNSYEAMHRATLTWRTFGWKTLWRGVSAQLKADPLLFSPNKDGTGESIFFMPQSVEIKDVKNWELAIHDANQNLVMSYKGKDVLPKIISWEGQTYRNNNIAEGRYFCTFIAEGDGNKRARSSEAEIMADLTSPAVSVQVSTGMFSPDNDGLNDGVTFYISVSDMYGISQWQLEVLNDKHKKVMVFKSSESIPVELLWNGFDGPAAQGRPAVNNGNYEARITAWDLAGNKSTVDTLLTVNSAFNAGAGEPVKEAQARGGTGWQLTEEERGLKVNLSSQALFGRGKSKLKPDADRLLDEIIALLQSYPENDVLIEGYTDSTGSRNKNIAVSSERAWAVYSYLAKHGVGPSRLKPKGYGPDNPVASNKTAAGRAKNLRIEIIILKQP